MFGSNLGHHNYVSIKISEAELDRDLHRDYIYPGRTLIEFRMTDAQWASVVSSSGMGSTIPVTLERISQGSPLTRLPEIEPLHASRKEQFDLEFEAKVRETLNSLNKLVKDLEELSDQKTISKKSLKDVLKGLKVSLGNLPSNLKFTTSSFRETTSKMVEDAKAEIEAYIMTATQRVGLESLRAGLPPETLSITGDSENDDNQ